MKDILHRQTKGQQENEGGKLCGEIGWLEGRITFGELGRKINVQILVREEIMQCVAGSL